MSEQPKEYQCSWCKRDKFNGDESCPLDLEGTNGNSDIFDGVNRVIKSCGCGAFVDTRSRPAPQTPAIGSIRQNIYQEDAYLIERVNAGMGEWEYVIQYCGEYYATAPTENIARDIVERAQWIRPPSSPALAELLTYVQSLKKKHQDEYTHCDPEEWGDPATYGDGAVAVCDFIIHSIEAAIQRGQEQQQQDAAEEVKLPAAMPAEGGTDVMR